jgi:hypothetical protein
MSMHPSLWPGVCQTLHIFENIGGSGANIGVLGPGGTIVAEITTASTHL